MTENKLNNFKVVAGVMNNTKLDEGEDRIIQEIRAGELLEGGKSVKGNDEEDFRILDEDSEDEIEEITVIDEVTETVEDIPTGDLKPKDLRSLIMSYIEMINKVTSRKPRSKFNLYELKQLAKVDKNMRFFEEFCLAVARKCQSVKKGFKVGHIFVTHSQVNLILNHGILSKADIENKELSLELQIKAPSSKEDDLLKSIPFGKLRTFIIDFHNFLCGKQLMDIKQLSQKHAMSESHCRRVMAAVTSEVNKAPVLNGKVQGIKVNNIFVSSGWVEKIKSYKIL